MKDIEIEHLIMNFGGEKVLISGANLHLQIGSVIPSGGWTDTKTHKIKRVHEGAIYKKIADFYVKGIMTPIILEEGI